MDKIKDKNIGQFLKKYKQLCLKYGMVIDACGCCDSPQVFTEKEVGTDWRNKINNHIKHLQRGN